ncbi:TPA: TetR/AcrR family transcriptional regulator [Pseudomonas aeruginosa]|nr:TetR/AcrR family transcriptional regulator [Pseudomonas aeruginosa]
MAGVRQFDEEKLLAAVLEVFWNKGWQATSMADLAEAAEVQRGSLYHAYGGKEELFLLAFDLYARGFLDKAARALRGTDARSALLAFLDAAIGNMTSGDPPRGCLTTKTAAESVATGPRIQQRLRDLLTELRGIIVEALSAEPLRAGLALPPEEAAELLLTFTRGLAVIERIYHDPQRLRRSAMALVSILASPA